MKKTIVALAVAAFAATSANAAVVYNQDGTKLEVKGSVRLLLQKAKDKRADLLNDGSRLEVAASHNLGEGLTALAYGRVDLGASNFKKDAEKDSVELARLYAGFKYDGVGTLTFGRQLTNGDDLGYAGYSEKVDGLSQHVVDIGNKVVHFKSADFNGFTFGADYIFDDSSAKKTMVPGQSETVKDPNNKGYVLAAFYERKMDDFGFGLQAGYSRVDTTEAKIQKEDNKKAFTVAGQLSYAQFAFGVDYSREKEHLSKTKTDTLLFGVKYDLTDMAKLYAVAGKEKAKVDGKTTEKVNHFGLGMGYKLHANVQTFLEYGKTNTKKYVGDAVTKTKDHSVNLGLRVFF
ncbi:outer membrane protein [Pasteurella multocida subsp. multocida OH4807]|nr:outer membrane protein [Pasteurella multocida subsp. multocida OH4807]